ncbi:penicillin-binding protein 2, partial [Vibrio parahaemolyticus EKP-021]
RSLAWARTKSTTQMKSRNTCVTTPCLRALLRLTIQKLSLLSC